MSTKLDKTIRREIEIDGEPFTIAISPDGFRLTRKRFRSGVAMSWKALWTRQHGPVSPAAGPPEPANEPAQDAVNDRTTRQEPGKTA